MDVSKTFDPYEIIGVITPGAVLALLLMLEWPELRQLVGDDSMSIGDLGLFLVIAFVLGHLIQGLGNLIETVFWAPKGLPTAWVRSAKQTLITPAQRTALIDKVLTLEPGLMTIETVGREHWRSIATRMYGKVRAVNRAGRIDTFNRTYGMFRGLAASFLAATAWYAYEDRTMSTPVVLGLVLFITALWRMRRVSLHYARALLLEFIDL